MRRFAGRSSRARGAITADSAWVRQGDADYFAPLVTNGGTALLRVTVNAGLAGARDCECAVRPGATRVFIGYYRLYRNSTVRARSPSGAEATFRDLGPQVTSRDGTVGLRFDDKDLRPLPLTPPHSRSRRCARSTEPGVIASNPYFSLTLSTATERSRSR